MVIKITELEQLVDSALKRMGYIDTEIKAIAPVLLYAQLRGNNQGVVKLIGKGIPKNPAAGQIDFVRQTRVSALINGNHNQGMVVMDLAVNTAISKAREHDFAIVGTNNTASSTGAIGYYAEKIAKSGFIGFVFAGSPETVNTHGSYEPIFGTNPLAIGIPTDQTPIVLDMATAAMAYFGLIEAKTAGKSIPENIAYDQDGNPTTDPEKAMKGAIRPFDKGHKGAGLAMIVEILTGPLVSASFTGIGDTANNWGNLVLAINPELLVDKNTFLSRVSQLADKVRHTRKLPGVDQIFVPGERGNRLARQRTESGEIDIETNLLDQLRQAAS